MFRLIIPYLGYFRNFMASVELIGPLTLEALPAIFRLNIVQSERIADNRSGFF